MMPLARRVSLMNIQWYHAIVIVQSSVQRRVIAQTQVLTKPDDCGFAHGCTVYSDQLLRFYQSRNQLSYDLRNAVNKQRGYN